MQRQHPRPARQPVQQPLRQPMRSGQVTTPGVPARPPRRSARALLGKCCARTADSSWNPPPKPRGTCPTSPPPRRTGPTPAPSIRHTDLGSAASSSPDPGPQAVHPSIARARIHTHMRWAWLAGSAMGSIAGRQTQRGSRRQRPGPPRRPPCPRGGSRALAAAVGVRQYAPLRWPLRLPPARVRDTCPVPGARAAALARWAGRVEPPRPPGRVTLAVEHRVAPRGTSRDRLVSASGASLRHPPVQGRSKSVVRLPA